MTGARPKILFAWELGANFGHANKIARAAERLQGEAEIFVAAREVTALRQVAPDLRAQILPAPFGRTRRLTQGEQPPANFAAMLATEGWDDAMALGAVVEAWRGLFQLIRPDLIIAQAAPTALLAARGLGRRNAVLGGGYDNPPLADPMPPFDRTKPEMATLARDQEAAVLSVANQVLSANAAPEAAQFRDILTTDLSMLMTWPELDHYDDRATLHPDHPPYLGSLLGTGQGEELNWSGKPGARILAYLRPGSPPGTSGLKALAALGPENDIILSAPGISASDRAALSGRGLQVTDRPVRLDRLLPDCDLGISHASNGVGAAFLASGVPQLGLPTHREQAMFARTLARGGIGLGIDGQYGFEIVCKAIRQALDHDAMRGRVRTKAAEIAARGNTPPDQAAATAIKTLIS